MTHCWSELVGEYVLILIGIQATTYLIGLVLILIYGAIRLSSLWRNHVLMTWTIVQAFGFAALAVGWLAGDSRTPVLGTLLPAVLTFLGGFLVFVFGQDGRTRAFVLSAVPLISLMLYVGTGLGSFEREHFYETQKDARAEAARIQLKDAALLESAYIQNRTNLSLGPAGPATTEIIHYLLHDQGDDGGKPDE